MFTTGIAFIGCPYICILGIFFVQPVNRFIRAGVSSDFFNPTPPRLRPDLGPTWARLLYILLRPINTTLQIFGSQFLLRRLGRIIQGIVIFTYAITELKIEWTLGKVIYIPLILLGLICFFGGLFIIGATFTFWTIQSIEVVNIFTYGGSEMMSYPMHIYQRWMRQFFTFIIPAIFLNYYPALYILGKSDPFNFPEIVRFISPIIGIGILMIALRFWRFGIRHYQSTGT